MSDCEVENEIIELYNKGKWQEIIELHSENAFSPWIWPNARDLEFIADWFRKNNGETLVSVGCGSGLFEWLLSKATGIEVLGIELDESWWTSKYAKMFIPVCFLNEPYKSHERAAASDAILLFCYFNNEKAFMRYIESFKGKCFIVIGPGPEKNTYTIPEPFSLPGGVDHEWKLSCHREIGKSQNYIAVYLRSMEQNLVSDEVIKRINNVLNDSKEKKSAEERLENSSAEKFHDVYESIEVHGSDAGLNERTIGTSNTNKDLESENRILSTQLEAERKKSRDLQSKLQLFENSAKYFERLNGQLEEIKQTVEEDSFVFNDHGDYCDRNYEAMQKLRPKTVHTAATGGGQDDLDGIAVSGEPHPDDTKDGKGHNRWKRQDREEVTFRDADDFKQLDQGLEIVRDKLGATDSETEKVFITKTEKQCLEDIGNLASRMRTPIDDKHQRYFEKDRKRFANRIVMPETQEVDKTDSVPVDIVTKTKETPVNITSTELDGLRSYLLQLKELIARRETAWARTTERDYNQRVEITRFKNEVTHLRMLCEKRQKDIKERDQMIIAKDEEIKELQKRIQSLKSTVMKLEKKDDRVNDTSDGITDEVLENSHLGQKSYNTMKKGSITNRGSAAHVVGPKVMSAVHGTALHIREQIRRPKTEQEKSVSKKLKSTSSNSNDEEPKTIRTKSKAKTSTDKLSKSKQSHTGTKKKSSIERVDEKLQQIEEMLHSDALKPEKKGVWKYGPKGESKASASLKVASDVEPVFQKFTLSSSKMRQEMLGAMTGLGNLHSKLPPFPDPKRSQGNAALLANALLSARNTNVFRL